MADKLDPKELVTAEELAISSMWEMAAIVGVLGPVGAHLFFQSTNPGFSSACLAIRVFSS